jgi:hypothetical protein
VGLFDWLSRPPGQPDAPSVWHVHREGDEVVVEDGRGAEFRASVNGARGVRVVPLRAGQNNTDLRSGWQVALAHSDGDALVGQPMADWRSAHELAKTICATTGLPFDELTEKMFSRVGQYTPKDT